MMEEDRAGEQARVAARSVLANIEELNNGGLDGGSRDRVIDLARKLSARGGSEGRLDRAAVTGMTIQLRELLAPVNGLTASTVRSWLDDIEPAR
ncbi:hypothetical protein [Actinomycetospora sp.]|uniref:hypothetical protein n=1 Tax=Actinomycetospora sp. TaxID=1872135 RepID=UPI002F42443F